MQGSYCPSFEPAPPAPPPTATLRENVEPAPPMPSEPMESSEPLEPLEPVVTLPPTSNILSQVLDLARQIKEDHHWIGYSAFLVFSILIHSVHLRGKVAVESIWWPTTPLRSPTFVPSEPTLT